MKVENYIENNSLSESNHYVNNSNHTIKVVELFAGVGGFRLGLEKCDKKYKVIWSNQWEPTTKI